MITKMNKILCVTVFSLVAVSAQLTSFYTEIIPAIRDCYNNSYLLTRDNRLPHNMYTLIEILRKIEDHPASTMTTLKSLSTALLHGFRQDGIKRNENSVSSLEIIPYASKLYKFKRFVKLLRTVPGNAVTFPNDSISDIEKCTLHFMLSDTIELEKREGEDCNRNYDSAYRYPRSVNEEPLINKGSNVNDDVEMLSPQEIKSMTNNRQIEEDSDVDPNSFYPEFPPNHPAVAQYIKEEYSACPVSDGVVKTNWGEVKAGSLIAAVAAAVQPQLININELMRGENVEPGYFQDTPKLNNKWFATITGDLAALCWHQGPITPEDVPFMIGTDGKWNSSEMPKWFFLNSNDNLELTKPLLRGDMDGFIIANEISFWSTSALQNTRLSQVLDMYYSSRGLFNPNLRACNRKQIFSSVASIESFEQQTYSAVKTMRDLADSTIGDNKLKEFSKKAVRQILNNNENLFGSDISCAETDRNYDSRRTYVDLTIVLDTSWPFKNIQLILAKLLESIEVMKYNSNFTLINGNNGDVMINTTNTILDLYNFTERSYERYPKGLEMLPSILIMKERLEKKLDTEQRLRRGGGNMDVILFVPYLNSNAEKDRDQCVDKIRNMREEIPDSSILVLTPRQKENWVYYVEKHEDVFVTGLSHTSSSIQLLINSLSARFKQFPKRLINSQCGSKYVSQGSQEPFSDSVEPRGIKYYRIHPNYFYTSDGSPSFNIQPTADSSLTICRSRELMLTNRTNPDNCETINGNSQYKLDLNCGDASFIHKCQPYYISVRANSSSSYHCMNCRFPDEVSYKISYSNLVCTSGASSVSILPVTVFLSIGILFKLINI